MEKKDSKGHVTIFTGHKTLADEENLNPTVSSRVRFLIGVDTKHSSLPSLEIYQSNYQQLKDVILSICILFIYIHNILINIQFSISLLYFWV